MKKQSAGRRVRREKIRRKKMQMREKVGKSRNTVFFRVRKRCNSRTNVSVSLVFLSLAMRRTGTPSAHQLGLCPLPTVVEMGSLRQRLTTPRRLRVAPRKASFCKQNAISIHGNGMRPVLMWIEVLSLLLAPAERSCNTLG